MALDPHHSLTHSLSHRHAHWLNDRGCQDRSRESSSINAAHAHFTAPHSSPLSRSIFTRTEVLAQASTHTDTQLHLSLPLEIPTTAAPLLSDNTFRSSTP
ncbi:hypothetical protein ECG_02513 [Echinococcus granulosus]|uniref:Expressed protein n=1 Tax=Echinococcus granulosus TaxID=6210 RepID=A0A068WNZ6_ECHGR|nr:hypothetical protein ECG_02513 [Echinococcus granulosus]CDS21511.1 expressed protein [Echinococcus granulosus]